MAFCHRFKQKIETVSDHTNVMISFFHDFVNIYSLKWHTSYSRNIMCLKCGGDCGLWVLNEIIQKKYPENMKKIVGAV